MELECRFCEFTMNCSYTILVLSPLFR